MAKRSDSIVTIWSGTQRVITVFATVDYLTKEELTHLRRLLGLDLDMHLYGLARDLAESGKDLPPSMAAVRTIKTLYDEIRTTKEQEAPPTTEEASCAVSGNSHE
ncbi:MAG: hypothetical protein ACYC5Y_15975 [Symbiobacteriia bacterium]